MLCFFILLTGCRDNAGSIEELKVREVKLPGGQAIKAETVVDTRDIMRGLMFRTSLAPDHGMLFVHRQAGNYGYWMYQTYIPLDMIWMDDNHNIVEIAENAPPCKTAASKCPTYGGHKMARFVLELNAGQAQKYGLRAGQTLQW
jgi:uncharacterized membrane protein (UPF0127 family)